MAKTHAPKKSKRYIFRPWIRLKDGRILYAKDYGYKAWRIPI